MSYGRRNSYTIDFKVLVVDWLRKNEGNISKAAREFDVDRKRVREWNEKYDQLKTHHVGQRAKRRKIGSGRTHISADLDQRVFEFLEDERAEGRVVTNLASSQAANSGLVHTVCVGV